MNIVYVNSALGILLSNVDTISDTDKDMTLGSYPGCLHIWIPCADLTLIVSEEM